MSATRAGGPRCWTAAAHRMPVASRCAFILNQDGRPEDALEALGAAAALLSSARGEGTEALLMQVHLDRAGC